MSDENDGAPATDELARGGRLTTALGWGAGAACLPAILGVLGVAVPMLVNRGQMFPEETLWERTLVQLVTWSTVVAVLSPPATLLGLGLGIWFVARRGWRRRSSKVVAGLAAAALSATAVGVVAWHSATHRRPNPAAEQSLRDLSAPNRSLQDDCDRGKAEACNRLAFRYDNADGVPRSGTVAARYYAKACELGESNGCMNGGTLYFYGAGDPQPDAARGLDMLQRACNLKHSLGCLKIGIVYQLGHGVPPDRELAFGYFQRACDLGLSSGCQYAGELLRK
jgi:hypothetical protein